MPKPSNAEIKSQYQKALFAQKQKNYQLALSLYSELLQHLPGKPEILFQMGKMQLEVGAYDAAKELLLQAYQQVPDEPEVIQELSNAHTSLGEHHAAIALLDRLIKMKPKAPNPRANKAHLLQQIGEFEKAELEFKKAIDRNPLNGELYRSLSVSKKFKRGDPLIRAMIKAFQHPRSNAVNKMQLGFGLSKALDDTKEFRAAFAYLKKANDIQADLYPFDRSERRSELDTIKALYDQIAFEPLQEDKEFSPVFVCGMPRSGTTLVERIIASHSKVTAAGEHAFLVRAMFDAMALNREKATASLPTQAAYEHVNAEYRKRLRSDVSLSTQYVTDKSIQSYLVAGPIACTVPSARFVILRRDPADVALSIYRNFFRAGAHRYANRLEDIAWYYKTFEEMVAYWKAKMPDRFYEISYEELTSNQEAETRKLFEFVGLDWEDQVMDFHKSKGQVKTLSLQQVRQPISQKSVGGWRRYEQEMQPFIDAMETQK